MLTEDLVEGAVEEETEDKVVEKQKPEIEEQKHETSFKRTYLPALDRYEEKSLAELIKNLIFLENDIEKSKQ